MNDNLYGILSDHFPNDDQAPCLILPDGKTIGYGDLERESARCANVFMALGLTRGDRVAVQIEKTPQALFLYLGCIRAGLVFLPLNPAYQHHELQYFLDDAKPGAFIFRPQMRALALALAKETSVPHCLELDDDGSGSFAAAAACEPDRFATVVSKSDDLAAILYTSGTTGRSKGAMLSHRNLAANARVLHEYWAFQPGDVLLHMLPIFHVHGLFVATHCALMNGSPMLFEPKFDARRACTLLPRATVFMGVPTYYARLLAEPAFTKTVCATMRLFVSGSAPLLADTFSEFQRRSGHTILERYGMTETGMLTSNPYRGERRAASVGFPLPGTDVRVVDDQGRLARVGIAGHIEVRGDNVFSGYWQMPERTAEEFTVDGWFRTGDMGLFDTDGYLAIIGRSKDLIISGGFNVYPKEIELLIDALPGVAESAVIGLPHADFGEAVCAVVVRRDNDSKMTEADIIAALKERLANFKVPKRIFFANELPRNSMGKVQKNVLRKEHA